MLYTAWFNTRDAHTRKPVVIKQELTERIHVYYRVPFLSYRHVYVITKSTQNMFCSS